MGTSQAINPSVKGDPNWGNLSRSFSLAAKNVGTPKEHQLANIARNLIGAVSGSRSSGGGAKTFGSAGGATAQNLMGFISGVRANGLNSTLADLGMPNILSAKPADIINFLIVVCTSNGGSLDETAAKSANDQLLEELLSDCENIEDVESVLQEVDGEKTRDLLINFFTNYIVEFSTQLFHEKIFNKEDGELKQNVFKEVRFYIREKLKEIDFDEDLSSVDWQSQNGKSLIDKIQQQTLEVFE